MTVEDRWVVHARANIGWLAGIRDIESINQLRTGPFVRMRRRFVDFLMGLSR